MLSFVANHGFLDGIVRGYKCMLLTTSQYSSLAACEAIEDMRIQLSASGYGETFKDDTLVSTGALCEKLLQTYVAQFKFLKENSYGTLTKLLDFVMHGHMIDNVVLVLGGALREKDDAESLVKSCHPLGRFEVLGALGALSTMNDSVHVYASILMESPLRVYFERAASIMGGVEELASLDPEFLRAALGRAHLERFAEFAEHIECPEILESLQLEADRRSISLCLFNSLKSGGIGSLRLKALFPQVPGTKLEPFLGKLVEVDDLASLKAILGQVPEYKSLAESPLLSMGDSGSASSTGGAESIEDFFYARTVALAKQMFETPYSLGVFYAWSVLREQEIRNVRWIAECVSQKRKERINNYLPIF